VVIIGNGSRSRMKRNLARKVFPACSHREQPQSSDTSVKSNADRPQATVRTMNQYRKPTTPLT